MGGHAEAGVPDGLRQLDVLEQLRVNRRLAAGKEEHVEPAGVVEDELPGGIGIGHRPMRRIELLDAEDAFAIACAGAADVEDTQILVPRPAFWFKAEAEGRRI